MLLRVKPVTGRTHQIRVHFAALGRPIVGDLSYGGDNGGVRASRLFLHCQRLVLRDLAGEVVSVEAPLPSELDQILQSCVPLDL